MFARTERLLLRPGFPEDATALARAIGDELIVRNLATVPWPYTEDHARTYLAGPHDPRLPALLALERTDAAPRLVGAAGLSRRPSGAVELGYWIARPFWGRGLATEACAAVIEIARTLGFGAVDASHFIDNPASGRVLEKLGFAPLGITSWRHSCARGSDAPVRLFRKQLARDSAAALAA